MSKTITIHVPMRLAIRGGRKTIISDVEYPKPQPQRANALVQALAKAHRWRGQIENGEYSSITELAKAQRVNESYACRLLRLSLLAPRIVADILNDLQNQALTLRNLTKPFSVRWDQQLATLQLSTEKPKSKTSDCALMGQQGPTVF